MIFFLAQRVFIEGHHADRRQGVGCAGARSPCSAPAGSWTSTPAACSSTRAAELVAAANWRAASRWPRWPSATASPAPPPTGASWPPIPAIDAVVVGTPNACTPPQAIACLEAGKHVLVEKPMARTLAEAEAMNAAAAARPAGVLMVAHCWRFHADVRALRGADRGRRAGRDRQDPRLRRARRLGPVGLVHRPRAGRRRRAAGHGRPRHRHRPVPARRPAARSASAPAIGTRYGDYAVDDDGILLIAWVERHQLDGRVAAGGSRTWPAWRPTPRCTAPAATRGSGTSPRARRATSTARSRCTRAQMAEFIDAVVGGPAAAAQRRGRRGGDAGRRTQAYRSAGGAVTVVAGGRRRRLQDARRDLRRERQRCWAPAPPAPATGRRSGCAAPPTRIGDAIERALDGGRPAPIGELEAAVFGLAGVDWPSDVPRLESALEAARPEHARRRS